jgi:GntR family transcriptional regulator, N-acetylglucosamine utilization regulator
MYSLSKRKGPLYARIREELLSKIERGIWPVDHKVPTENELIEQYKVSRGTVRQALSELETEGYITRIAAKGTFVTRTTRLEKNLSEITSFNEQLVQAGFEPVTRVLRAEVIKAAAATAHVIEGFGIAPEAEVVHIQRLKMGNNLPFAIQSVYLLPDRCPGILEEDLTHLFRLYAEKYNRRILTAEEIIRVARAARDEAALLDVHQGDPVVIRDRVSFDQHNEPFEVLHSIDRGERFEYRYTIVNDHTRTQKAS